MKPVIILLAPPGGGKGTQAFLLKEKGYSHLATGDLLREMKEKTENRLSRQIAEVMSRGELISDTLMLAILKEAFMTKKSAKGFIFDGFPRNLQQAEMLEDFLKDLGLADPLAVYLDVPDELIVERIIYRFSCQKCGQGYHEKFKPPQRAGVCDICGGTDFIHRKDDTEDLVARRLAVFHEQTEPLLSFYKQKHQLYTLDGTCSIEDVFASLESLLRKEKIA